MRGLPALAAIGFAAGLRSVITPAAISNAAMEGRLPLGGTLFEPLSSPLARNALLAGALFEIIGDKLPTTPRRTILPLLAWRIATGALCGMALAGRENETEATGAALGGLGALAGSYGGYWFRQLLTGRLGVPNVAAGMIEDVGAVALASLAVRVTA
ncbi:MAG TPA: DUF4126 family protein [Chloroflexota bacterium]|nr:DUF4126 family protein [Chloroflexota bacterium]